MCEAGTGDVRSRDEAVQQDLTSGNSSKTSCSRIHTQDGGAAILLAMFGGRSPNSRVNGRRT